MGTGTTTLLWYGLCCGMLALTVLIAAGLVLYGQRAGRQRREARQAEEAAAVRPDQAPVSMRADSSSDREEES